MTLEEILSLEEANPCPGCPVCQPRLPRRRARPKRAAPPRPSDVAPSDRRRTAASPKGSTHGPERETEGA